MVKKRRLVAVRERWGPSLALHFLFVILLVIASKLNLGSRLEGGKVVLDAVDLIEEASALEPIESAPAEISEDHKEAAEESLAEAPPKTSSEESVEPRATEVANQLTEVDAQNSISLPTENTNSSIAELDEGDQKLEAALRNVHAALFHSIHINKLNGDAASSRKKASESVYPNDGARERANFAWISSVLSQMNRAVDFKKTLPNRFRFFVAFSNDGRINSIEFASDDGVNGNRILPALRKFEPYPLPPPEFMFLAEKGFNVIHVAEESSPGFEDLYQQLFP